MFTKTNWTVFRLTLILIFVSGLLGTLPVNAHSGSINHTAFNESLRNIKEDSSHTISLQELNTPLSTIEDDCRGMMWVNGSFEPETADQVKQELSQMGVQANVEARGYGEIDGCDIYTQYGIDFTITLKNTAPKSPSAQQALVDDILPTVSKYGKPNLGNVKLVSSEGEIIPVNTQDQLSNAPQENDPLPADAISKNVYVIVYDPLLSNSQTLSEYMNWNDHATISQQTVDFFKQATGNKLNYTVVDTTVVTSGWPELIDGFTYTESEYLAVLADSSLHHEPKWVNYNKIVNDSTFDICGKANRGEIDEVWIYNGPWFGFYESRLVGPGAYYMNSSPLSGAHDCNKLIPIMGPSVERIVDEAVHNFTHRTESTMTKVYGSWYQNSTSHNWNKFGLVEFQSSNYSYSGCGSSHFPPNGVSNYDYANSSTVLSNCDDFANYPNLGDPLQVAQNVTCSDWGCTGLGYYEYWFNHMPTYAGCGPDTFANDWWKFIATPGAALFQTVVCQSDPRIISGDTLSSTVTLAYNDGTPKTVNSDIYGNYFLIIPDQWTGTVTPSKNGFNFTPPNRDYVNIQADQNEQDYSAEIVCPTITAWKGEYWINQELAGIPELCRNDANLDFQWGGGSPDPSIPADNFSARWTRTLQFTGGDYRFYVNHDDGARLFIDDVLQLDVWDSCCSWKQVDVPLTAGDHTIRLEMFENNGGSAAQMWWETLGPYITEIDLQGNDISINDGDNTPTSTDLTDFGTAIVAETTVSHTFTIYNTGESTLNLPGSPKVALSGSHASDFTVTTQPVNQIRPAGSSTFTIQFDPTGGGLRTATVSIPTNDLDENPFNFSIQGNGFEYPHVDSITRAAPNPTNSFNVDFNVTFSEDVTGVDLSDFALTTTGLSGASLATVNGSGANYTVSANTGTGNGTIRLDLVDDNTIENLSNDPLGGSGSGNGDFTSGETYTVDKVNPLRYVKWDATGTNNGTSWADAYTDLQSALSVAGNGDEIWVAAGTYYPTSGTDRTISFPLGIDIGIYGGFAGTETLLSERDVQTNVTILSGDIGIVDDDSDNSYHVLIGIEAHSATLDGFTITAGNANGSEPGIQTSGGGIYNKGSLTLSNNSFISNTSTGDGGAIFNYPGSSAVITDSLFFNNSAQPSVNNFSGGAITNFGTLSIIDSEFIDNYAVNFGGAIVNISGSVSVQGSTFTNNTTPGKGGAISNNGGTLTVTTSVFSNNSAGVWGGAINIGDYPEPPSDSNATISDSTFFGNSALTGGGIHIAQGTVQILRSTFNNNSAEGGGGIVHIPTNSEGSLDVSNSTFYNNSSTVNSVDFGSGIYNTGTLTLTNSTFSGNTNGGIHNTSNGSLVMRNTILANNNGPDCFNEGTITSETNNLIKLNGSGGNGCGTPISTADPLLGTLQDNGGSTQTMALLSGSPAIDAGDDAICPSSDQRGVTRPFGNHCDIGAYEFSPTTRFVKHDAIGANDGTSWTDAYTDLQDALLVAQSGDEIWVAAGTYYPTSGTDRTISFVLNPDTTVYGGFAGTETLLAERDWETNVTFLSGDLNGDDNGFTNNDENSYHVVVHTSLVNSTLDGFTITGGNANGDNLPTSQVKGGGIYNNGLFTSSNNSFEYNRSAIVNYNNSTLIITNNTFSNNSALPTPGIGIVGGAIINYGTLSVIDSDFIDNYAEYFGGAIVNAAGSVSVQGSTFTNNTTLGNGGAINNYLGSLTIENSVFSGNSANKGGAINIGDYPEPGYIDNTVAISESTFTGNNATYFGGGVHIFQGTVQVSQSIFNNNSAEAGGGIAHIPTNFNGSLEVSNSTFYNNSSTVNYIDFGSGIFNQGALTLTNSTLSDNTNGGLHNKSYGSLIMRNTILANNNGYDCYNEGTITSETHNLIKLNGSGGNGCGTPISTADPLLGSLQDNGGSTQTMALLSGSPAIDAGDDANCPATDQRGVTRPFGAHCDIGAYEFNPATHYVKHDATGANNGTSWTDAYTDLQDALSAASSGDEIWVAAGTYYPTSGTDRTISFELKNGVAIYGGFAGTETLRTQRDFEANVTVLSGDIGNPNDNNDNSFHVVVGSNTNNSTLLDGFTITHGKGEDISSYGAGMYNYLGSPTVQNTIFDNNNATFGAGMYNYGEDFEYTGKYYIPIITNVIFKNNTGTEGAGMRNDNYSSPILTDVTFDSNSVDRTGGGMENVLFSNPTLTNVTFVNNSAAGGIGGGMSNIYSDPYLINVTFHNNSAEWGGGMANGTSNPSIVNVTFSENTAVIYGGGISNEGNSNPLIQNTILWGNTAPTGAQIYNDASTPIVSDSVIEGGYAGGTNIITTNPKLGTLGNYGGFTETIPISSGSSAIDTGDDANCPATDQRGVVRPQGSHCDIGAYEADNFVLLENPSGTYTNWDHTFYWTGILDATWYLLEVQTSDGTQVFRKWYTSTQTACSGNTTCSITPANLNLSNGDYKWRIMDYGAYGYGSNTAFLNFNLNVACYTLITDVSPVSSGSITAPTQNCTGGYTAGSIVELTPVPNAGYIFDTWSGDANGASNPTLVTMDGNKSITANFTAAFAPISPSGTLTSWNNTFTWTGLSDATWYLIEVQDSSNTQVFRKWYTSDQTGCTGNSNCSVTATELSLANGDYKWRIMDYGDYGYGANTPFLDFTLNHICYTLTTNVTPVGTGTITAPAQTCTGGYAADSVIQLTAVPNTGYTFTGWSNDANGTTNPISITMDGNKTITANMRGNTPLTPSGTLTNWNKTFTWTGLSDATWYLIEVQTSSGTQVFRKWYTSDQTSCTGGTNCSVTTNEISLANGDYKWRVMDYGAYGYGINSAFKLFTLDLTTACHTLTIDRNPAAGGVVNTTAQNCAGGYTTGTVVEITAVPNSNYIFDNWTGDLISTSNPVSITMNGDKAVTANFKAITVLTSPSGTLNTWDNTFTWSGIPNATWYLLEVYTPDNTQVFRKWYTSDQTGCLGGTACSISPPETASLANGDYKWKILDYGAYGYGIWTPYMNFTLDQ